MLAAGTRSRQGRRSGTSHHGRSGWGRSVVSKGSVEGVSLSADGTMLATAGAGRREALGRRNRGGARPGRGRQRRRRRRLQPGGPARRVRSLRVSPADQEEKEETSRSGTSTRRSLVMRLRPDLAPDVLGYTLAFSPGRPGACQRRARRPVRSPLGRPTREGSLRELEQNLAGAHSLEFRPDGRTLAVGGYGEPYAALLRRRDGGAARPEAHGRQRHRDGRCVP